ncbi:hypothetical protein GGU10DRAFT_253881, partial [Lentinula aff. detonsa]
GHLIKECFQKGGGKEGQYPPWWKGKRENQGTMPTNLAANVMTILEVGELTQHYGLTVSSTGDQGKIFADSGASDHFFRNRADFTTY